MIRIKNAKTHNLNGISLAIPHHQFIVVTGISGSGKSSLAFDIIAKEGQRRYVETLPSFARQFMGKISPVNVDSIEGLSPVITVSQKTTGMNSRSTVGTLTDLYSWLRLLYARNGYFDKLNITSFDKLNKSVSLRKSENAFKLTRSLFSFNSNQGKCMHCNGLGIEEEIDLKKLIIYPEKTIREGALAPTLPTGYIMYSQVTIDVLNQVCEAEGFNVDIVWNDLTETQKKVILYGSEKIKVPFGKHSLESRLKWTGIKAKPREEGYYKGMIPIMSDILRRDRNANILKYVSAITCTSCKGKRLNELALSVLVHQRSIADLLELSLLELGEWINAQKWDAVALPIIEKIHHQIQLLSTLGLAYLTLNKPAKELSGSEIQRIRVNNQIGADLSNVLYVFDEPSIGLHPSENQTMITLLKSLVNKGNTVIVVEHDLETIKNADWIIDIGPKAGKFGGELLFNGSLTDFLAHKTLAATSPTFQFLSKPKPILQKKPPFKGEKIELVGCNEGKLSGENFSFHLGQINVVTGKSGGGKADLVKKTLKPLLLNQISGKNIAVAIDSFQNIDQIDRLVYADQSPIGRTPRSNPATYLGLSDHIRDLFSKLPESKEKGLTKSHFSFNTKGGRCEQCQGAGKTQIGMHFLGKIDLICNTCAGKRFNSDTLSIRYKGKSISDIYELSIDDAIPFFETEKKIHNGLVILGKIGLGYLSLGQTSTTLSGGEAQRIKLANELQKKSTGKTLYILDEPSIGLHAYDLTNLLHLFDEIIEQGNTLVCIEQDEIILNKADQIIELNPTSGSRTSPYFGSNLTAIFSSENKNKDSEIHDPKRFIQLNGVSTHLLKNIDIAIPKGKITAVTGLSGSGKSSLVYDSLYAEASGRFSESLSTFNRSLIQSENKAVIDFSSGLTPTIAIQRKKEYKSGRSTVGTVTGIHAHLRLLFSRIGQLNGEAFSARHFSFNHKLGACPQCKGYGFEQKSDPDLILIDPQKSVLDGALSANKAAKYFTNLEGQFIATLKEVAKQKKANLFLTWKQLSTEIQDIILYGTGEHEWEVEWEFKTKTRSGKQKLTTKWLGFCNYIDAEFERRRDNKNIQPLLDLLHDVPCVACHGDRIKPELLGVRFKDKNIAEINRMSIEEAQGFIQSGKHNRELEAILTTILPPVNRLMQTIIDLGLGYLSLDRITSSLSGGELQRIRLAGQLSAQLYGVTYVLDEPTIGLDQKQIAVLIKLLKKITEIGNTVVVIEHDKSFISASDYLIELGPLSGQEGGSIIYQGPTSTIKNHPETVTHSLLYKTFSVTPIKTVKDAHDFGVKGAIKNNLKRIDITFQSNSITAVTGVSGSGKSTLIKEVLYQSLQKKRAIGCSAIFGFAQFDEVLLIDQSPIALNALNSPAIYTGILSALQTLFAKQGKDQGFKKGDFSYQSKTGKCENCNGYGELKTSMDFMSDLWITCDICQGSRYNNLVESIKIQSANTNTLYSISEVLKLTIQEVLNLFADKKLNEILEACMDMGIGHLQLGQAGNTLSGGEAQRLKLVKALLIQKGTHLYLFDEPSTGLHQLDLLSLINVFGQLIAKGHSVVFIEHNSTLISIAHHEIRLGPGSGAKGGELIS